MVSTIDGGHYNPLHRARQGSQTGRIPTKPKSIFFSSTVYEHEEGSTWKMLKVGLGESKPGIGYICVVPLTRYRPKALREVRERVESHAEAIHALCDVGDAAALEQLKAILTGAVVPATAEAGA